MPSHRLTPWLLALTAGVMACSGGHTTTKEETAVNAPEVITVRSADFGDGEPIPARFTCDGDGVAPTLSWDGVPDDAQSLALVVDDPDAPRGTFVHWVVLDMPPGTTGVDATGIPTGAVQARNSAGRASYFGPCPPSGTHHYRFTVYALSKQTGLHDGAELADAVHAVESTATARGRLVGTYARHG
ncbi:MAG TPA: YbhB/YbcL family Raf kinase inhibitor-like protein [Nocardioidaceae bacterium]|nr:YbhB/YbcL family Raf kinase inhibitor-like protein [Nocardioidaceae bacterium]